MIGKFVLIKTDNIIEKGSKHSEDQPCYFVVNIIEKSKIGRDWKSKVLWFYDVAYNELHFFKKDILFEFEKEPSWREMENMEGTHPEYWL